MFGKRRSPNKLKVTMVIGAKPWLADTQHILYEAGKAAVKRGTYTTQYIYSLFQVFTCSTIFCYFFPEVPEQETQNVGFFKFSFFRFIGGILKI